MSRNEDYIAMRSKLMVEGDPVQHFQRRRDTECEAQRLAELSPPVLSDLHLLVESLWREYYEQRVKRAGRPAHMKYIQAGLQERGYSRSGPTIQRMLLHIDRVRMEEREYRAVSHDG